jgi:hypothetical protein
MKRMVVTQGVSEDDSCRKRCGCPLTLGTPNLDWVVTAKKMLSLLAGKLACECK